MPTDREIFDKVKTHLLTQKQKSGDIDPKHGLFLYKYRDSKGNKCAVGCLIPDDIYKPGMEGAKVSALVYNFPSVVPYIGCALNNLLDELQKIHDQHPPEDWETELSRIEAKYFPCSK